MIFGEPQPWAILAGVPNPAQAATLVRNIRHFLGGIGEPGGPSRIGATQVPAFNAPGVTEHGGASIVALSKAEPLSPIQNADEWPGGSWYDINGWLTWALASLQGEIPHASRYAWNEYLRNTLANHAAAFPDAWDGIISSDDVCNGYYSSHPQLCGNDISPEWDGQNTEQPTWMVMDAIRLAGVTPTESGFLIAPHLPLPHFSLRLPDIGVAARPGVVRGYVRVQQSDRLTMIVSVPSGRTRASGRGVRQRAPRAIKRAGRTSHVRVARTPRRRGALGRAALARHSAVWMALLGGLARRPVLIGRLLAGLLGMATEFGPHRREHLVGELAIATGLEPLKQS